MSRKYVYNEKKIFYGKEKTQEIQTLGTNRKLKRKVSGGYREEMEKREKSGKV